MATKNTKEEKVTPLMRQYYAMKQRHPDAVLLFRMCGFYPELMDEFRRTLEAMEISYYKPAVKSVRNKMLAGKMK